MPKGLEQLIKGCVRLIDKCGVALVLGPWNADKPRVVHLSTRLRTFV